MSRERGERQSGDERDLRDERRGDDPRDERDPRLPGDPADAAAVVKEEVAAAAKGSYFGRHFGRWLILIIAVGLAAVSFTSWQVRTLRVERERGSCESIVEARDDLRSVLLYLVNHDPDRADDPDVVAFAEFFEQRLPPLECAQGMPTPIDPDHDS